MMTYGFQFNSILFHKLFIAEMIICRRAPGLLAAGVGPRPLAPWGLRWLETQSGTFILLHWGAITPIAYISVADRIGFFNLDTNTVYNILALNPNYITIIPSPPLCRRRVWRGWSTSTPRWWWWWWPTWRSTWSQSSTSTSTTSRPGQSGSPGGKYTDRYWR